MTVRDATWICVLAAGAFACGGGEGAPSSPAAPIGSSPAPMASAREPAAAPSRTAGEAWVDPEPAGAQALAEAVVAAEWNRKKTTGLEMTILPLVDRTTGIQGFATALAARESSVEDRLAKLGAEVTATEVVIRLPGSVLFDFDSAAIRPDAERTLGEVAAVLSAYGERPIRVEGHTDSIASDAYNQGLSEKRAAAVVKWLGERGVAVRRMRAAGFGESRPVADNATSAGRQGNRRVEIVIEKGA